MILLAIDTATEACSAALWQDGAILEHFEVAGREHSVRLPGMVKALLAEAGLTLARIDGLVAGIGPGSFAGVRIGVAYTKGLALGIDRPARGVSSLAMLAQGAITRFGVPRVIAAIDARMSELYAGAFDAVAGLASGVGPEQVGAAGQIELPECADVEWTGVGTGWAVAAAALSAKLASPPVGIDAQALPHARDALVLAAGHFLSGSTASADGLTPNYLRNRVALTQVEQAAARAARPDATRSR